MKSTSTVATRLRWTRCDKVIMDASELIDHLSVRIYEPPLSNYREDGRILDTSNPLAVIMLLIDYETECSMNGITGFLSNSSGLRVPETIEALRRIGCTDHAEVLNKIGSTTATGGMTHAAIQKDRAQLESFAVTSFVELHGDKWDQVLEKIHALHDAIDWDTFWPAMTVFVASHKAAIQRQF